MRRKVVVESKNPPCRACGGMGGFHKQGVCPEAVGDVNWLRVGLINIRQSLIGKIAPSNIYRVIRIIDDLLDKYPKVHAIDCGVYQVDTEGNPFFEPRACDCVSPRAVVESDRA